MPIMTSPECLSERLGGELKGPDTKLPGSPTSEEMQPDNGIIFRFLAIIGSVSNRSANIASKRIDNLNLHRRIIEAQGCSTGADKLAKYA